jgi:hypothetical protein
LRLIFWGGLICVLDITFSEVRNGEGWKFDILNDLVGMLMITWGVFQLAEITVHDRYRTAMGFVKVVAVLSCVEALHAHFIYDTPPLVVFLFLLLGIAAMVATVVFSVAMRWLSSEAGLLDSAASWRTTTLLFVVIYLIPLGLFYCAAAVATVTGESFHIDLGPAGLFLVPVFFIPVIHLFMSTSRMRAEADAVEGEAWPDDHSGGHPDDFPFCQ